MVACQPSFSLPPEKNVSCEEFQYPAIKPSRSCRFHASCCLRKTRSIALPSLPETLQSYWARLAGAIRDNCSTPARMGPTQEVFVRMNPPAMISRTETVSHKWLEKWIRGGLAQ